MAEAVSSRVGDSNARAQKEGLDTRARKVTRQYQMRVGGSREGSLEYLVGHNNMHCKILNVVHGWPTMLLLIPRSSMI